MTQVVRGEHDYSASEQTTVSLIRAQRELRAQLALMPEYTPARIPIENELSAVRAELSERHTFTGTSILDLEAERAKLEHAIDHLGESAQPDLLARMRARLDLITAEIGVM